MKMSISKKNGIIVAASVIAVLLSASTMAATNTKPKNNNSNSPKNKSQVYYIIEGADQTGSASDPVLQGLLPTSGIVEINGNFRHLSGSGYTAYWLHHSTMGLFNVVNQLSSAIQGNYDSIQADNNSINNMQNTLNTVTNNITNVTNQITQNTQNISADTTAIQRNIQDIDNNTTNIRANTQAINTNANNILINAGNIGLNSIHVNYLLGSASHLDSLTQNIGEDVQLNSDDIVISKDGELMTNAHMAAFAILIEREALQSKQLPACEKKRAPALIKNLRIIAEINQQLIKMHRMTHESFLNLHNAVLTNANQLDACSAGVPGHSQLLAKLTNDAQSASVSLKDMVQQASASAKHALLSNSGNKEQAKLLYANALFQAYIAKLALLKVDKAYPEVDHGLHHMLVSEFLALQDLEPATFSDIYKTQSRMLQPYTARDRLIADQAGQN